MAEHDFCSAPEKGGFKEAVCIDAMRIYDSCSDKEDTFYKSFFLSNSCTRSSSRRI